jgi:hypothetical protein
VTHADLVNRAEWWLRNTMGCGLVLTERACGGIMEIPDAIGWAGALDSILVECKTSRSDFTRDRHKPFRNGSPSLGRRRFFLTPERLLEGVALPEGWGLIEVRGAIIRKIFEAAKAESLECLQAENALLYALGRRTQLGCEPTTGIIATTFVVTAHGPFYPASLAAITPSAHQ